METSEVGPPKKGGNIEQTVAKGCPTCAYERAPEQHANGNSHGKSRSRLGKTKLALGVRCRARQVYTFFFFSHDDIQGRGPQYNTERKKKRENPLPNSKQPMTFFLSSSVSNTTTHHRTWGPSFLGYHKGHTPTSSLTEKILNYPPVPTSTTALSDPTPQATSSASHTPSVSRSPHRP